MRYLVGSVFLLAALGIVRLVGCGNEPPTPAECVLDEDCDDQNECTNDSCVASSGCSNSPIADGRECDFDGTNECCPVEDGICMSGTCQENPCDEDPPWIVMGATRVIGTASPASAPSTCAERTRARVSYVTTATYALTTSAAATPTLPDAGFCPYVVQTTAIGARMLGLAIRTQESASTKAFPTGRVVTMAATTASA